MYSPEERTILTGEINDMSAGCITLLPRSLHVINCRDRLIILSGFQEKGGCPLIRACSVIASNTVYGKCVGLNKRMFFVSKSSYLVTNELWFVITQFY